MNEQFTYMLAVGGKSNSLGRTSEVIDLVLHDKNRLDELYSCVFNEDAWIRMRAIDALEKICRQVPEWISPYIDKFLAELHSVNQASIQWHLTQIYRQVELTDAQIAVIINWLKDLLRDNKIDWIVAANAMDTLMMFHNISRIPDTELIPLLHVQQSHASNTVVKRANKYLSEFAA